MQDHRLKVKQEQPMSDISRLQTGFIMWLCAVLLVVQWGCATQSVDVREPLGTGNIGVVSARYTPAFEFELPAKGWLGGAGRGAVGGTKAFIVLVPSAAVIAGASFGAVCCTFGALAGHGLLGALWAAAALVKGAGYLIVGPFYGAAKAEAPVTIEEAETHLKEVLASLRIQETMSEHVVRRAQVTQAALNRGFIRSVEGQGPESPSDLLTYFPVQDTDVERILELRVTRMWLSTNESFFKPLTSMLPSGKPAGKGAKESWDPVNPSEELQINPPLALGMEVRGRLIRTADKVVLFDNTWAHEGESHVFADWAANDAKLFVKELERAYDQLSNQIVTTVF